MAALDGGRPRLHDRVAQLFRLEGRAGNNDLLDGVAGCGGQAACRITTFEWFVGTITAVSESGESCLVEFDDGEISSFKVRACDLRIFQGSGRASTDRSNLMKPRELVS